MSAGSATAPPRAGDHGRYIDRPYLEAAAEAMQLPEPQKVLFAGDIHGRLDHLGFLAVQAARVDADAIVQLGDLGYWPHTDPAFIRKADRILSAAQLHLIAIDGNHENFAALREPHPEFGPWRVLGKRVLLAPRGALWRWQDKRILAIGGAASIDKAWRQAKEEKARKRHQRSQWLWWPDEEITDADVEAAIASARAAGGCEILLCHDAPESASLPLTVYDHQPSRDSRRRLQRVLEAASPEFVLHGHYHVRYSGICGGYGLAARIEGLGCDGMGLDSCMALDLREPLPAPPQG
jgi:hypothetical protein